MSTPEHHDPSTARFRRGAGRPVGPPGPPPARIGGSDDARSPWAEPVVDGEPVKRLPEPGERPISMADIAGSGDPVHPAPFDAPIGAPPAAGAPAVPRFDVPAEGAPATTFGELLEPHESEWPTVDVDPGRRSGVVAIVVGFFVGLVGLFIGIASIRSSRRVGLTGALGTAGIVVSVLNIVVGGVVGISWVRYEVSLQQQCALVGPGQYVTQSGGQVTCP